MKGDTRSLGYSSYIDNLEKLLIPVKLAWITALSSQGLQVCWDLLIEYLDHNKHGHAW